MAVSALPRMLNLGVPDYLITTTIEAIIAQRLVRRLCPDCREPVPVSIAQIQAPGLRDFLAEGQQTIYRGVGCDSCKGTGYRGRVAIHELFIMDNEVQQLLAQLPVQTCGPTRHQ